MVESFGFHVELLIVFSSTLDYGVILTTLCYIYIYIYIHTYIFNAMNVTKPLVSHLTSLKAQLSLYKTQKFCSMHTHSHIYIYILIES